MNLDKNLLINDKFYVKINHNIFARYYNEEKKQSYKSSPIFIGFPILVLCIVIFPIFTKEAATSSTRMAFILYGILTTLYLSAIPFLLPCIKPLNLTYIDRNEAFSRQVCKSYREHKKLCSHN